MWKLRVKKEELQKTWSHLHDLLASTSTRESVSSFADAIAVRELGLEFDIEYWWGSCNFLASNGYLQDLVENLKFSLYHLKRSPDQIRFVYVMLGRLARDFLPPSGFALDYYQKACYSIISKETILKLTRVSAPSYHPSHYHCIKLWFSCRKFKISPWLMLKSLL
jgi:hypothetical protein